MFVELSCRSYRLFPSWLKKLLSKSVFCTLIVSVLLLALCFYILYYFVTTPINTVLRMKDPRTGEYDFDLYLIAYTLMDMTGMLVMMIVLSLATGVCLMIMLQMVIIGKLNEDELFVIEKQGGLFN